jgi:hypothetical protein
VEVWETGSGTVGILVGWRLAAFIPLFSSHATSPPSPHLLFRPRRKGKEEKKDKGKSPSTNHGREKRPGPPVIHTTARLPNLGTRVRDASHQEIHEYTHPIPHKAPSLRRRRRCLSPLARRTVAPAPETTGSSTAASSTTCPPRPAEPSRGTRPRRLPTPGPPRSTDRFLPSPRHLLVPEGTDALFGVRSRDPGVPYLCDEYIVES